MKIFGLEFNVKRVPKANLAAMEELYVGIVSKFDEMSIAIAENRRDINRIDKKVYRGEGSSGKDSLGGNGEKVATPAPDTSQLQQVLAQLKEGDEVPPGLAGLF